MTVSSVVRGRVITNPVFCKVAGRALTTTTALREVGEVVLPEMKSPAPPLTALKVVSNAQLERTQSALLITVPVVAVARRLMKYVPMDGNVIVSPATETASVPERTVGLGRMLPVEGVTEVAWMNDDGRGAAGWGVWGTESVTSYSTQSLPQGIADPSVVVMKKFPPS
jgi:hypothetical protein